MSPTFDLSLKIYLASIKRLTDQQIVRLKCRVNITVRNKKKSERDLLKFSNSCDEIRKVRTVICVDVCCRYIVFFFGEVRSIFFFATPRLYLALVSRTFAHLINSTPSLQLYLFVSGALNNFTTVSNENIFFSSFLFTEINDCIKF